MTFEHKLLAALLTTAAIAAPSAAWAAFDQSLVLTGPDSESIATSQLSFKTNSGVSVPVVHDPGNDDDDDDNGGFIIAFPGNGGEAGNLTYIGTDGNPRTVALPATPPNRAIVVNIGTGQVTTRPRQISSAPPSSGLPPVGFQAITLMPELAYTSLGSTSAGYGVLGAGNPDAERFAKDVGGRDHFVSYGGTLMIPLGKISASFAYHQGSSTRTDSATIAEGGDPRGLVYIGPLESGSSGSPPSTGINVGLLELGIMGWTDVRQRAFDAKFGLPLECNKGGTVLPYVRLTYAETDIRQQVDYTLPVFADSFRSTVHHDFETDTFGVGLGVFYNKFLSEQFSVGLNVEGKVNFNDRKLRSWQTVDLFGNFDTINIDDDVKDTSFDFGAELSATYHFTPSLGLNLFGGYRHYGDYGRIDSVLSGNDILDGQTVQIGSSSADQWYLGGRLVLSFGRGF